MKSGGCRFDRFESEWLERRGEISLALHRRFSSAGWYPLRLALERFRCLFLVSTLLTTTKPLSLPSAGFTCSYGLPVVDSPSNTARRRNSTTRQKCSHPIYCAPKAKTSECLRSNLSPRLRRNTSKAGGGF